MRAAVHTLLAALLLSIVAAGGPAGGAAAAGQPPPEGARSAYDTVATCLRERGHLLLLALIDESGSLRASDPDNRRVAAIKAALRSFAQFGRGPNSSDAPKIELLLAAFATNFSDVGGWGLLNRQTLGEFERRADEFAARNRGQDTDFATAFDGAKGALARKESEVIQSGSAAPCRLLLVFTDGQYDIDSRDGPPPYYAPNIPRSDDQRIEDAGRRFLCDPDGVADQLRATDTVMVAIALRPDRPGPGGPPDQTFLRNLVEAQTSGGAGCGNRTEPPGALVEAPGLGRLLEAFDSAVVQALGGTNLPGPAETGVCAPDDASPQCVRTFELDTSLSEFHILADLVQPGIAVEITPPGGAPARLSAGTDQRLDLGGATLDVVGIAPQALVVDGSLSPTDQRWVGTWTVRFVDETGTNRGVLARAQITVFGGLTAVADPVPTFRAGESTEFPIKVIDAVGSPRTPAEFVRSATVTAAVVTPSGERQDLALSAPRADGSYLASHAVAAESTDPYVSLELTLDVTTRGGLQLRPRVQSYQIPVQPPAGFPIVAPATIVLSRIVEKGAATGTLTITGTPGATGCLWIEGITTHDTPGDIGALAGRYQPAATSQDTCVKVQPGQTTTVSVSVTPERVRSGVVEASLRLRSVGADPAASRATALPVRFEMEHQPGAALPAWFAALLTAGVLLPLGLLWLLNWITARFTGPGLLRRAVKRVRVTPDDLEPLDGAWSTPLARDFTALTPPDADAPVEACRRFRDHAVEFRARVSPWPFRLPYGSVQAVDRDVLASGGVAGGGRSRYRGRIWLGIHPAWVFVVERVEPRATWSGAQEPPTVTGTLLLYITDGDNEDKARNLIDKARRELPPLVADIAPKLPQAAESTTPSAAGPDDGRPGGSDVFVPPIGRP